jgi:tight adherence protein B
VSRSSTAGPPALRLVVAVGASLAMALLGAGATQAATSLHVSEGGGATFPARSLVLSVPSGVSVQPSQVHVSEDGQPIPGAIVRPIANAAAGDFGVVLAIDVGPSMRGEPLARAMEAARALAAQRTGNQELAVVTFDQNARVALPLTANPQLLAKALAQAPRVGHGAYIYNAMTLAVRQLANANMAAGAVILLSDGASQGANPTRGKQVTASSIGAAAVAAHAQIYTVGLRDSSYTPARMSLLARVGGGEFIESTSTRLAEVFTQIEAGLTSAYVVRYRSPAPHGHAVKVSIAVDGILGAATLSYTTGGVASSHKPKPRKAESFWASSAALVAFSSVAAMLICFGLFVLVGPRLSRVRLRRRVGEFTASGISDPRRVREAAGSARLAAVAGLLEGAAWWKRFRDDVAIARLARDPLELVALTVLSGVPLGALLGVMFGTFWVTAIVVLLSPAALRAFVRYKLKKQRELFADQLPSHLQEVASAMRAGHSLVSGITTMAREAPEPSRAEWKQVIADEQLGVPLDEAMRPMSARMGSDDVNQVALVAALHHRTGGNMAEVLERVADSVRERAELRRELSALTAQARLSRYIVTLLPLVVAGAVALIDPGYIRPLFHTTAGLILVFIAVGLLSGASLIMRAITNIEV